jgi:peptidase E
MGKLFFGISAGSIMLAKEWVRWSDPDNDDTAEIFPCLGIAPIICDTHAEQDNWAELQTLLKLEKDDMKGYGITSGTAIKVYPNGEVVSLGGATHHYIRLNGLLHRIDDVIPSTN